ncbi:hypothetical protein SAMN05421855_103479 [Ulvibacter litoralis]|uniref:Uncharacterized protein n=1 Tax=Ulvibacter litoralis TaxID=227084 RepID=A0A1G7H248_9FLAO|nr:hypothetical protein GCM10008083_24930 [Ulvibacter litoralis]SDE94425.1 hypothetical protein SAMN05421855_103479 [Ulvibacter litoralis]
MTPCYSISLLISDTIPELSYCGKADDIKVPNPHFGCIVDTITFTDIKDRLEKTEYKVCMETFIKDQNEKK